MGHLAEEEYLVKENIDEYLDALALRINETGIGKHRILVVGGAAIPQTSSETHSLLICSHLSVWLSPSRTDAMHSA